MFTKRTFLKRPPKNKIEKLLKRSRNYLSIVVSKKTCTRRTRLQRIYINTGDTNWRLCNRMTEP